MKSGLMFAAAVMALKPKVDALRKQYAEVYVE
jgi:hypothetical protein